MGNLVDNRTDKGLIFIGDYLTVPHGTVEPDGLLPPTGAIRFNPQIQEIQIFKGDFVWDSLNSQDVDTTHFLSKNGGNLNGDLSLTGKLVSKPNSDTQPSISFDSDRNTGISSVNNTVKIISNNTTVCTFSASSTILNVPVSSKTGIFSSVNAQNIQANIISSMPYDFYFYASGKPASNQILAQFIIPQSIVLLSGLTNSQAFCGSQATNSTQIQIVKIVNGTNTIIGSITWAPNTNIGSFNFSDTVSLKPGDVIQIIASTTVDSTLADLTVTLCGIINVKINGSSNIAVNNFINSTTIGNKIAAIASNNLASLSSTASANVSATTRTGSSAVTINNFSQTVYSQAFISATSSQYDASLDLFLVPGIGNNYKAINNFTSTGTLTKT